MKKILLSLFTLLVLALILASLFFFADYLAINNSMRELGGKKKAQFDELVEKERKAVKKYMEEKYHSEMSLYEETVNKLKELKKKKFRN